MTAATYASTRAADLQHSRLGVIYFLGNLRVDFAEEEGAKELKKQTSELIKSKVAEKYGDGMGAKVAGTVVSGAVGTILDGVSQKVDEIAKVIEKWLVERFNVDPEDARLGVNYVKNTLPSLILGIQSAAKDSGAIGTGYKDIASGLYTGISKTIEYFELKHAGSGVVMESGHPDIIAASIKRSVGKSALVGLAEAALAGAKAALAAFTGGVGIIINKIAGVIEKLLRFAVRFCDARTLQKVFTDAREKWICRLQNDAIQTKPDAFADWFQKTVNRSAVVAALVMNCGVAGDPMMFLQMTTADGVVVTQGQFDKGVTFLNALKSSAADLITDIQKEMRISSADKFVSSRLKYATEIGLVQKEAGSSWRSRLFAWSHEDSKKGQVLSWALNKVGFRQSTVHTTVGT